MIKLSNRLSAVANLVSKNSAIVDVGCDHGYIPVYLVENSIIKKAVACDINEKPLKSCIDLVKQKGFENNISCVLSNGLDNVVLNDITDIIIAGMGGELIADILSRCDCLSSKHLILNPMTHPEIARKWLYDNGFDILSDIVVQDSNHYYSVFDAVYTNNISPKTRTDYYLGNIKDFTKKDYFEHLLNYLNNKQKGGENFDDVISSISKKMKG